jgi:hypothetical protein
LRRLGGLFSELRQLDLSGASFEEHAARSFVRLLDLHIDMAGCEIAYAARPTWR